MHSHHLPRQPVLLLDSSHWHTVSSTWCQNLPPWAPLVLAMSCGAAQHNSALFSHNSLSGKKQSCPYHILFSSHSLPCTHSQGMILSTMLTTSSDHGTQRRYRSPISCMSEHCTSSMHSKFT